MRGGHGGHGHGGRAWAGPWDDSELDVELERQRAVAGGALSTGTGALIVLALLAWAVVEADRRVPR